MLGTYRFSTSPSPALKDPVQEGKEGVTEPASGLFTPPRRDPLPTEGCLRAGVQNPGQASRYSPLPGNYKLGQGPRGLMKGHFAVPC